MTTFSKEKLYLYNYFLTTFETTISFILTCISILSFSFSLLVDNKIVSEVDVLLIHLTGNLTNVL